MHDRFFVGPVLLFDKKPNTPSFDYFDYLPSQEMREQAREQERQERQREQERLDREELVPDSKKAPQVGQEAGH